MAYRRRARAALATATSAALLASCVANPGPAPIVEPEDEPTTSTATTTTTRPEAERTEVSVGVDPVRNGFNPHLLADTSGIVDSVAQLVLPSAFRDGVMDTDLLVQAGEVAPGEAVTSSAAETTANTPAPTTPKAPVQSVRYEIDPAAQWSDGTPITGADFIYLWESMTTTPGVIEPAGYRAILEIRTANGGKTVEVDFAERVDDWQDLFANLLPSHLAAAGGSDFATAFHDTLPAAAGAFKMESADRSRGQIILHRNDRFWGKEPARLDILRLRFITSVTQGVDLLRSGQVSFLDRTPEETSVQAYQLVPGTQTRLIDGPRQLQLDLNVESPILSDVDARAELDSLIDVPLVARQAAGRSSDLDVPPHERRPADAGPPPLLPPRTAENPLRIAADPADAEASAAVRTIADALAAYDVRVEIVSTDLPDAAGGQLPDGDLDAIVSRARVDSSRNELASRYLCPPEGADRRDSNLSGFCSEQTTQLTADVLAGTLNLADAEAAVAELNAREHLTTALLGERRVIVLGEGIVGPDSDFSRWTGGLSTAATWTLKEDEPQ